MKAPVLLLAILLAPLTGGAEPTPDRGPARPPARGPAPERTWERTWLPVVFHVARADGAPVADGRFIEAQLERANAIFAPYGVGFVAAAVLPGSHRPAMRDRRDRDSLAPHVRGEVINCFVVASLLDVDEPGRVRRGVHWHAREPCAGCRNGDDGAHYVILSAISEPGVLAHELGHFLGNRRHSHEVGNLMSYDWGGQLPVLDARQTARMRARIRRYLESGELRARPEGRAQADSEQARPAQARPGEPQAPETAGGL